MTHSQDCRHLTNEALQVHRPQALEIARVVRDAAMQAAAYGAHHLVDPIPSSVDEETALSAYALLASVPYAFRVSSQRQTDGSERWTIAW